MAASIATTESTRYDLAIVGGGINGLAVAWDAALRGLSVVLLERNDFGSGSSHGCFRIAHGGLRYLQHGDLRRLRESVQEQRFLRRAAPHLVAPLPFLVPCYGYGKRSVEFLRFGLSIYEWLARDRNQDIAPSGILPAHQVISKAECLERAPFLNPRGLRGGVIFFDCQLSSADRLTIEVAVAAARAGAKLHNYTAVVDVVSEPESGGGRRIVNLVVEDTLTGEQAEVRANEYVFASGVWNERLESLVTGEDLRRSRAFSKGVQVVLPKLISDTAVALESSWNDSAAVVARGNRSYFLVPWQGRVIAGTFDVAHRTDPDDYRISGSDVRQFIDELRRQYPDPNLSFAAVTAVFGGLRPIDTSTERLDLPAVSRTDLIVDHRELYGARKVVNLVTAEGVKYTTFRLIAERAVDRVELHISGTAKSLTSKMQLPYADESIPPKSLERNADPAEEDYALYLRAHFGSAAAAIGELAQQHPQLALQVVPQHPARWAELVYSYRHEFVRTLSDLLFRRSVLGALGLVTTDLIRCSATILGDVEHWDSERVEQEYYSAIKEKTPFLVSEECCAH